MARDGMRIDEVLSIRPGDIQECSLTIHNPKSGRVDEKVYVPRKIRVRLSEYVQVNGSNPNDRIFPVSHAAAWSVVQKAGNLVGIELKPHESRRHPDLSTTLRYRGKVNDTEAIRWIETRYG